MLKRLASLFSVKLHLIGESLTHYRKQSDCRKHFTTNINNLQNINNIYQQRRVSPFSELMGMIQCLSYSIINLVHAKQLSHNFYRKDSFNLLFYCILVKRVYIIGHQESPWALHIWGASLANNILHVQLNLIAGGVKNIPLLLDVFYLREDFCRFVFVFHHILPYTSLFFAVFYFCLLTVINLGYACDYRISSRGPPCNSFNL